MLVRTSCPRGCGPRAAWFLHRIDWTDYLSSCGLRATMLPGYHLKPSDVIRAKLDYVGQLEIPRL